MKTCHYSLIPYSIRLHNIILRASTTKAIKHFIHKNDNEEEEI